MSSELTSQEPSTNNSIEIWSDVMNQAIRSVPEYLRYLSDYELLDVVKPKPVDWLLRRRFHTKIAEYKTTGRAPNTEEIFNGIITRQGFYESVIKNPERVAWMICPMTSAQEVVDNCYEMILNKMTQELMALPITEKTMGSFIKALEFFANRSAGPVVQRIESKTMTIHTGQGSTQQGQIDVSDKLKELQDVVNKKQFKDVTPVEPE